MRLSPLVVSAFALSAAGCPKQPASLLERTASFPWDVTPSLPSPSSGTYGLAPGRARDPLVDRMTEGKTFDRALESAAAGLALSAVEGNGGLARWELREAAWRGGWPYPVDEARGWSAVNGEAPPDDVFRWVESVDPEQPMALVRARGRLGDGWVGMRAKPAVDLGALPRAAALGTAVELPALAGGTFRLTDGGGVLLEGPLDGGERLLLTSAGEWLLQIVLGGREVAKAPIYVAIPAPDVPVLRTPGTPPLIGTVDDADAWARELLAHVRGVYRLPAWQRDPLLDAAARKADEDPDRPTAELLAAVGLDGGAGELWLCEDVTVENCLDRWVWDPRKRAALLSTRLDAYGLSTRLDARGVHLRLVLGGPG